MQALLISVSMAPSQQWVTQMPRLPHGITQVSIWDTCHTIQTNPSLPLYGRRARPPHITANSMKPIPNKTAWWQRHMRVNNLPKVVIWQCTGLESNQGPPRHKFNMLPLHHQFTLTHYKCQAQTLGRLLPTTLYYRIDHNSPLFIYSFLG